MSEKENQNVELKSRWSDDFLKTICAFANSSGGKLYIGIDDKGKIVGVNDAKKLLEDIPNKIKSKLFITPFVSIENKEGKDVIVIEVLPSTFPVFYEGKIFVRSGSTTQELTGLELSSFLIEKTGQTWDKLPSDAEEKDLDDETIEKFISLAEVRLPLIKSIKSKDEFLKKLNLYTKDGKLTR
ncbi:MAG: helix-turn-helix domain-containing protein [Caldisericum sp.]